MTSPATKELQQELVNAIYSELGYAPPFMPAFLTEKELATVLKSSPITLRTRRYAGRAMPAYTRIGKSVLYRPSDVAEFILSNRHEETT